MDTRFSNVCMCCVVLPEMFCAITNAPNNALVVRCEDKYANMSCISNSEDEIAWSYDGNTHINSPCLSNSPDVFEAVPRSGYQCDIRAWLANATENDNIRAISGTYGCTDRSSGGITGTSIVVVLGTFRHFLHYRNFK